MMEKYSHFFNDFIIEVLSFLFWKCICRVLFLGRYTFLLLFFD
jgi:hypothetical protein